jgi:hypothetical protein
METTNLKKICDEQEKELLNFRNQLNENQLNSNSHLNSITAQLIEREDQLNKIQDEVSIIYSLSLVLLFSKLIFKNKKTKKNK